MTISATTQGVRPGVCTSTNRPANPFDGQVIYMTDVDQTAVWDGTAWTVLAPIAGGRNLIINGGFDVWQRGTSFTANNVYTADRWWFVTDGVGTATVTQQAISSQGLGFTNCLRAERSAGTNRWVVGTNLETVALNKLKGKTVTLSFYARKGSALTSNLSVAFETKNTEARFGSAVDTGTVTVSNSSMNTLTFTRFTGTLNVPVGTSAVGFALEFSATQAGAANAFFEIAGVQVEAGAVATLFEFEDIGTTLARCQRYFQNLVAYDARGGAWATTAGYMSKNLPVTMRTQPSATLPTTGLGNSIDEIGLGGRTPTSFLAFNSTPDRYSFYSANIATLATATAHIVYIGPTIPLSAEL
jgi:hypothetical protein